jgi:RNA polymerase sigma factor for flagellar operon FliA
MRKATYSGSSTTDLWRMYRRTGDNKYKNQLAEHYLPLVKGVAERIVRGFPKHVDPEDLTSAGIFGLFKAIENYDPDRGTRFETYCRLRVKGSMLDELRSLDWIPRDARNRSSKLENAVYKLKEAFDREPSYQEIASSLSITMDELKDTIVKAAISKIIPMDVYEIEKSTDSELAPSERMLVSEDNPSEIAHRNDLVDVIYASLSQTERFIVMFYYHEDLTMKEIGEVMQVSESRICQLHSEVIEKLKGVHSDE